ncbi:osmoprotectant ABC transporter substrate-binding protein [Macrococcoides canis]|uniref:osmoprotectant ABC transporter substrate-binding protein n=1 Tax=Macrococcoides canis TaxID=1855823 RepID=UPI001B8ABB01|nr:osmoprotectant ABC transporter substrate-binding protein [Macrococcus canis]QUR95185.1 osmoprotectant ABC transporter substrate-binding protein [Macrococcus canis]UTH06264.1 osmoprotectant ABC transporter substrate-binding protein [Macrococcus canis]
MKKLLILISCLILLSACSSSNNNETVKIASVYTTESQILAHMIKILVEKETDHPVELINNLGSGTVVHQAMIRGDANISSARYTGTDLTGPLGKDPITDPEKARSVVVKGFQDQFDQHYFDSYGFENTYAFMVTKATAKKYNLKTVSDMKKVAQNLRAGVDSSWMKRKGDGFEAFKKTYGFDFKDTKPMQIGLVYEAVNAGKMDVVLGYTTDGRIQSYDLVVLKDDMQFFPPYDANPVATNELLKNDPEIKKILESMKGQISTEQMQKLNYEVDNNLKEPAVVAEEYLKTHNYFKGGAK